ncbi:MAG: pyridoxamine kinase [Bacillota bacterium]|nr:pyridoxamine kinase [Bacillota bacterium]
MKQKRLLTIQDLSCFGKCSITVALPIISALGVETVVLPTAILSSHTGFNEYTFMPMEDEIEKISKHWVKEKLSFDAIYVGYIGNIHLIELVCEIIDKFKQKDTVVLIDPAMADNGKLYKGFDEYYVKELYKLCYKADILTPNITEAMLLTGMSPNNSYDSGTIETVLKKLSEISNKIIVTGVQLYDKIYTYGYEKSLGSPVKIGADKIEGTFCGAGDVFSSSFIGSYLKDYNFKASLNTACKYVNDCIDDTLKFGSPSNYGLVFENRLGNIIKYYNDEVK